ncbi:MAG: alpha,2-mannosyltransferase [Gaiellaceae bacterium]|nr:alpha,2-mannosyltransferase [Gaiellaceae bacterium]
MARAVPQPRPFAGALTALRQAGSLLALGVLPAVLVLLIVGGAVGHQFAFDFHGSIWEAARAVLHGHSPYPPPTVAGVAPGDRFVYPPAVAFVFIPLGVLPFPVAAALLTGLLLAAVAATLYVLDVRDWRCYGASYLAIPVLHDVRLGALTPLLALGLALAWRWREQARSAIPLAAVVVAKLFLWPLGVWLLATGRVRIGLRTAVYGITVSAAAWAAIGFAGLADYPRLLQVLAASEQSRGYSPVSGLLALGLGETAARVAATALGLVLLAGCALVGRRGDDRRSLTLALAAALALSPIVWLHYFVLLLVPLALARRTFSALWLVPLLFWATPYEEHFGEHWRIGVGIAVAAIALTASWRRNSIAAEM